VYSHGVSRMINDEELSRLRKVARDCANAERLRVSGDCSVDEVAQEAIARFLKGVRSVRFPTELDRKSWLCGIVRNVCRDMVRQNARRRRKHAYEAEVGGVLADALAAQPVRDERELAEIVRRTFLRLGLAAADVDLLLAVKLEGMSWGQAGASAGLGRVRTESSCRRISKFLAVPGVRERLLDELGLEGPQAPKPPSPEVLP